MGYTQYGLFGQNGVEYRRTLKRAGAVVDGEGIVIGVVFFDILVFALVIYAFVSVMVSVWTLAVYHDWVAAEGEFGMGTIVLFSSWLGKMIGLAAAGACMAFPLGWRRVVDVRETYRIGVMWLFIALWCGVGEYRSAFAWVCGGGISPWVREGFAGRHERLQLARWCYVSFLLVVFLPRVFTWQFLLFLLYDWGITGLQSSQLHDTAAQTSLVVEGNGKVGLEDYEFARCLVPLVFDRVPEDVMALVSRIHTNHAESVRFRQWAQLGDAVMAASLVHYSVRHGVDVGTISRWKQTCLSGDAMNTRYDSVCTSKSRVTGLNGVVSNRTKGEIFEAIVGAAYEYEYGGGLDARWSLHSVSAMQQAVALPKLGKNEYRV